MIGINNKAIHNILCGLYLSAYTHIYVQYIQQVNLLVKMCMSAVECTLTNDILMQGALSVSFEQKLWNEFNYKLCGRQENLVIYLI